MKVKPNGNKSVLVTQQYFQRLQQARTKFSLDKLGALYDVRLTRGRYPAVLGLDHQLLTALCRECGLASKDVFNGENPSVNSQGMVTVREGQQGMIFRAVQLEMRRLFGVRLRLPTYEEGRQIITGRESALRSAMGRKDLTGFLTNNKGRFDRIHFEADGDPFKIGVVIIA